ncbi:MAG: HAD family hydrolase [Actinomycetota bacterium]
MARSGSPVQGGAVAPGQIAVVFLDVGGPIYEDGPYYRALLRAIEEANPDADEQSFWEEFEACRRDQNGSFTRRLVGRFAPNSDYHTVVDRGRELWEYPPETLQPDARPTIERLAGRYRLGVLANQERWIRETLARDNLADYFEIWGISAEVGMEKPDPGIFEWAISEAAIPAERCVMVGDRLDNDIVPGRRQGMLGVWLLRGEAPDEPSEEQLAHADAAIRSLDELPETLERL